MSGSFAKKYVRIMCWVGDHLKKIDFVLWCFSYFVPSFFCFFASPLLCFVFPCVFGFPFFFSGGFSLPAY